MLRQRNKILMWERRKEERDIKYEQKNVIECHHNTFLRILNRTSLHFFIRNKNVKIFGHFYNQH